jgi:excisionase family DNA binding protein
MDTVMNERVRGMNEDEKLLTMNEAIEYLKVSRATLYRWIADKHVQAFKVGNGVRFYEKDVRALVTVRNEQDSMRRGGIQRDKGRK